MKKLFNKTIQKLRLSIFRYLVTISEETTRFIHLRFRAFSKDKHIYIYKVNVWFLKIISRLEVTAWYGSFLFSWSLNTYVTIWRHHFENTDILTYIKYFAIKARCYKVLFICQNVIFGIFDSKNIPTSSPGTGMICKFLFSLKYFRQFLKYQ